MSLALWCHALGHKVILVSPTSEQLTENEFIPLFARLKRRAGLTREEIGPMLIRDSFVLRYLQASGDAFSLRDLVGREESTPVKRSLCKTTTNWRA